MKSKSVKSNTNTLNVIKLNVCHKWNDFNWKCFNGHCYGYWCSGRAASKMNNNTLTLLKYWNILMLATIGQQKCSIIRRKYCGVNNKYQNDPVPDCFKRWVMQYCPLVPYSLAFAWGAFNMIVSVWEFVSVVWHYIWPKRKNLRLWK